MTDISPSDLGHREIELLLQEEKFREAATLLSRRIDQFPFDREARLYLLLIHVNIHGPERFENDIDELRTLFDLNDIEKDIVRRIFLLGHRAAETRGQEARTWTYQRLLRRLLLDQPLDQPIPRSFPPLPSAVQTLVESTPEIHAEARERVRGWLNSLRSFVQFASIPKWSGRAALVVSAVGVLSLPIVYLLFGYTPMAARHSVATTHRALASRAENAVVTIETSAIKEQAEESAPDQEETLRKLVATQMAKLRRVYGRWIAKNHSLMGSLLIKLKVDKTGRVAQVDEIASRLTDGDFLNAVIKEARSWQFPKGNAEAAEIMVPLLFFPKGTDPATIAQWEGRLKASQMSNSALSPVEIVHVWPVIDKGRTAGVKPGHSDAKRQETAAMAASQADVPEPATRVVIAYKTRRRIALREEPRFAAKNLEEIAGDTQVRVLEVRGNWLKVQSAHTEIVGFVRKEFLAPIK